VTEYEFAMLAATLKSVYQRDSFMSDSEGVAIWYELLKDIPYDQLAAAVQKYIKCETFPPTIADLRRYVNIAAGNDWSVAWNKLQSGAKAKEVDYAGQYAFVTIGRQAFESGDFRVMTEFQRLYREFNLMDKSVKQDLFRSGMLVWREEDKAVRLEQKNHDCKRLSGSAE
jgi:hypothetical protein